MSHTATTTRVIAILLRLAGVTTACAFLAMFLPVEWMAATHERLGLGPFPRSPLVDYLTRSIAALYGFHGCLLLIIATDPVKYRALVSYAAAMNIAFGIIMIAVDLHAGMPMFWTLAEGPPVIALGITVAVLNSKQPAPGYPITPASR
jgi:hypothetical protein